MRVGFRGCIFFLEMFGWIYDVDETFESQGLNKVLSQWCTVFATAWVNAGVEFGAVSPSLIMRCIHLS
jgi:hypothetical protein